MLSGKTLVAQVAPAVAAAIGEPFGLHPGGVAAGQVVTLLKSLGFRYCFDVRFAADVTIIEEVHEFLGRLTSDRLPMYTSCCPGWLELVDKQFPELLPNVSTCKSPQMMEAALVKHYFAAKILHVAPADLFLVSIMPCVKKQSEADKAEYFSPDAVSSDVDLVVTTAELAAIFKDNCLSPEFQLPTPFDDPLGDGSGGSAIFARPGGVMTSALRFAHAALTAGRPLPPLRLVPMPELPGVLEGELEIQVANDAYGLNEGDLITLKVAVIAGIGNAKKYVAGFHGRHQFVEVMACPTGCVSGGGQPNVGKDKSLLSARTSAVDSADTSASIAGAHENAPVQQLYDDFLGAPGSEIAHDLLHAQRTDLNRAAEQ